MPSRLYRILAIPNVHRKWVKFCNRTHSWKLVRTLKSYPNYPNSAQSIPKWYSKATCYSSSHNLPKCQVGPIPRYFVTKEVVSELVGIINRENRRSYPTEYENGKLERVKYCNEFLCSLTSLQVGLRIKIELVKKWWKVDINYSTPRQQITNRDHFIFSVAFEEQ